MTTTLPTITHRITYDRLTKDFACYVQVDGDGEQYIGSADSYHEGELKCLAYKRDLIDLDSRPIPRCADCGATLGDYGRCEDCDERTTDDTPLTAAWRAYKAGAMEWADVQAIQASLMPRCADHDRPAALFLNKRPACLACLDEAERVAA